MEFIDPQEGANSDFSKLGVLTVSIMHRLRAYHALLVVLVVAAYASGELGLIHAWLGYAIAVVIVGRILWAATGAPQLGLMRFYPRFEGLKLGSTMTHPAISRSLLLGIGSCLLGVTATGIAMDRGHSVGLAAVSTERVFAESHKEPQLVLAKADTHEKHEKPDEGEGPLSEVHEFLANLLMGLVGFHVAYLLLFKRPLARFMLFLDAPKQ
jgi:cytochrome b